MIKIVLLGSPFISYDTIRDNDFFIIADAIDENDPMVICNSAFSKTIGGRIPGGKKLTDNNFFFEKSTQEIIRDIRNLVDREKEIFIRKF